MSKGALLVGFVISIVAHVCLLYPGPTAARPKEKSPSQTIAAVDVVKITRAKPPEPKPKMKSMTQEKEPLSPPKTPQSVPESIKDGQSMPEANGQPIRQPDPVERYSAHSDTGSFAGSRDGEHQAALRIDWGSSTEAMQVIRTAGMRLVLLDAGRNIVAELVQDNRGQWVRRSGLGPAPVPYSTSLRIVDQVPAFRTVGGELSLGQERLAVMVPMDMERAIETAKIKAATQRGLSPSEIEVFGGVFAVSGGSVSFTIDRLVERTGS